MRRYCDHTTSDWDIVHLDHVKQIVYLHDLNLGNRSVTNDAENVVDDIYLIYPGWKIIYRDSMGEWSELKHDNGLFLGFVFINESLIPEQAR